MCHMDMRMDYRVECYAGILSNTHDKSLPTSCLVEWSFCRPYGMICLTNLLIRQLYHFCNRFRLCVAAAGGQWRCEHFLNTEWAIGIIKTFWAVDKKLCKIWFVIREHSTCDSMFA